jgi:hypothetical protein
VSEEMRAFGAFDGFADVYSQRRASSRYRGVNFLPRRDRRLACSALFFFVVDLECQRQICQSRSTYPFIRVFLKFTPRVVRG